MMKIFLTLLLASFFLCTTAPEADAARHHAVKQSSAKKKTSNKQLAAKKKSKKRGSRRAAAPTVPKEEPFHPADPKAYEACTKAVYQDAGKALQTAEAALKKKKDIGMRHCKALALFALNRYPEAATELEGLSKSIGKSQPDLWLSVMQQAATAREQAKDTAKARENLTQAVNFTQEREMEKPLADMLLERARLSRALGQPLDAVQDLDHALALSSTNYLAMQQRAQVLIELKQPELARKDLEIVVKAHPENKAAKEMLGRLGK